MRHQEGELLQEWFLENKPGDEMYWRDPAKRQIMFVIDRLPMLFGSLYGEHNHNPEHVVRVVGTHYSKSTRLPVYSIQVPEVEVRLRNNFYNWVVSVCSNSRVADNFGHILSKQEREEQVELIYAEGFTEDWIFTTFRSRVSYGPTSFSATLSSSDYQLFTFLYLLTEEFNLHKDWDHG